jgi:hypothetical protein
LKRVRDAVARAFLGLRQRPFRAEELGEPLPGDDPFLDESVADLIHTQPPRGKNPAFG